MIQQATSPDAVPEKSPPGRRAHVLLWCYRLFPWLLLPLLLFLSRDFGVTWDEKTHQLYGERVWRFLTQGQDDAWFHPAEGLFIYLHGGFFDTVCVAVQQLLSGDIYVTRHYVNAVFGWLGIVYAGRLGRLLAGPGTGLLAMALLTLSPRYFAGAMNNPKDVPLAALLTAALYYLLRLQPRHPYLGWRLGVPLVLAIGLAVNIRAGALLYVAYLAVALAGLTLATRDLALPRLAATAGRFALVGVAVLLSGTVFWPWAQLRPLQRPWQGMRKLSQFEWNFPVLFDGKDVPASALPWDYVPQWLLVSTPPVVLAGALVSLVFLLRLRLPAPASPAGGRGAGHGPGPWQALALFGAALFPCAYIAASGATIYDGIRHLTFSYPPLVVLSACGLAWLVDRQKRPQRMLAAAALALGLAEPFVFLVRNHPNQLVYFSALVGGPRGAFGRYELDYWGGSLLPAVAWTDGLARACGVRVVVSGRPHHLVRDDSQRFPELRFARDEEAAHHLEIVALRGPRQDVLELAGRSDILHAVTSADGAPLSVVVPGPRYADVAGVLRLTPLRPFAPYAR
jgi:4-amino-4-deoxy-L-arabinose transferase-like glycosyltransferase